MSVPCPIVTITLPPPRPANIVVDAVQTIPSTPVPYTTGQRIVANVQWRNTGEQSGTFVPKVRVNTDTIYGATFGDVSITLLPGAVHGDNFYFTVAGPGDYTICPDPNP